MELGVEKFGKVGVGVGLGDFTSNLATLVKTLAILNI